MKTKKPTYLPVLSSVWYKGALWRVSSRVGGVYQIERGDETRIAQRKQLKRYVSGAKAAE